MAQGENKDTGQKSVLGKLKRGLPPTHYILPLLLKYGEKAFWLIESRLNTLPQILDKPYLALSPDAPQESLKRAFDLVHKSGRQAGLLVTDSQLPRLDDYLKVSPSDSPEILASFRSPLKCPQDLSAKAKPYTLSALLTLQLGKENELSDWLKDAEESKLKFRRIWLTLSWDQGSDKKLQSDTLGKSILELVKFCNEAGSELAIVSSSGLTPCVLKKYPQTWQSLEFPVKPQKGAAPIKACAGCALNSVCFGLPPKVAEALPHEALPIDAKDLQAFTEAPTGTKPEDLFSEEEAASRAEEAGKLLITFIEVTQRCPLNCTNCFIKHGKGILPDPPLEQLEKAFDNLAPHTRTIWIVGFGEPLMRNDLPQIIRMIKDRGALAGITTSGMYLTEKKAEAFADCPPDYMSLSFSSFDPELFSKLRDGKVSDMQAAIKNARKYWGEKTRYYASYLTQFENLHKMPEDILAAAEAGFDVFIPQPFVSSDAETERVSAPYKDMKFLEEIAGKAQKAAAQSGIELYPVAIEPQDVGPCRFELDKRCIVRGDMSIGPCCPQFSLAPIPMCFRGEETKLPGLVFGYIDKQTLPEIFDSEKFTRFRQQAISDNPPDFCKLCGFTRGVYSPL